MAASVPMPRSVFVRFPVYYGWVNVVIAAIAKVTTLAGNDQGLGLITESLLKDLQIDKVYWSTINFSLPHPNKKGARPNRHERPYKYRRQDWQQYPPDGSQHGLNSPFGRWRARSVPYSISGLSPGNLLMRLAGCSFGWLQFSPVLLSSSMRSARRRSYL